MTENTPPRQTDHGAGQTDKSLIHKVYQSGRSDEGVWLCALLPAVPIRERLPAFARKRHQPWASGDDLHTPDFASIQPWKAIPTGLWTLRCCNSLRRCNSPLFSAAGLDGPFGQTAADRKRNRNALPPGGRRTRTKNKKTRPKPGSRQLPDRFRTCTEARHRSTRRVGCGRRLYSRTSSHWRTAVCCWSHSCRPGKP